MAATNGSVFVSSAKGYYSALGVRPIPCNNKSTQSLPNPLGSNFMGTSLSVSRNVAENTKAAMIGGRVCTAMATNTSAVEEIKEFVLPSWTMFELGKSPVYWKTMNGFPPSSGERLRIFYNPDANNITPNDDFGIGFNGGFNQPIMCGGEPRAMRKKVRGKADSPIYSIQICIPKHAMNLIFSFTNGTDWDGPYKLQFEVPKRWKNKPLEFFNQGLAEELSKEGACDEAIFPDASIIVNRCAMMANLTLEGSDRCDLNFVLGCTDPNSPEYDPFANLDDGSCPIDSDLED